MPTTDPCTLPVWFDDYATMECGLHNPPPGVRFTYNQLARAVLAFRNGYDLQDKNQHDVLRLANEQAMVEIHRGAEILWCKGRPLAVYRLIGDAFDRKDLIIYHLPLQRPGGEHVIVDPKTEHRVFYEGAEVAPGGAL